MAFTATVIEVVSIGFGILMEVGTWDGSGVTTGTITAVDGSADHGAGLVAITKVLWCDVASDADTQVRKAYDVAPNKVKLTFASGDAGDYRIFGFAR